MTSDEFRAIRGQIGLTQEELGKIMGIPQRSISRIESGKREPTEVHARFIRYIQETYDYWINRQPSA